MGAIAQQRRVSKTRKLKRRTHYKLTVPGMVICSNCGEIYNAKTYDKKECSKCGAPLYQRDDDKLETVRNRLEVYEKQTAPLINFYIDKLHKVNSLGSPADTYGAVKTFLDNKFDRSKS